MRMYDEIVKRRKAGSGPNAKSSPKEIVGHHAHHPHGKSILWPALYEHLRKKGYSKAKAAAISNGRWNRKHGLGAKNLTSTRVSKLRDSGDGRGRRVRAGQYGSADAAARSVSGPAKAAPSPAAPAAAPAPSGGGGRRRRKKGQGKKYQRRTNRQLSSKEMKQRKDAAQRRKKNPNSPEEQAFYDKINQLPPELRVVATKFMAAAASGGTVEVDEHQHGLLMTALQMNKVDHTEDEISLKGKRIPIKITKSRYRYQTKPYEES